MVPKKAGGGSTRSDEGGSWGRIGPLIVQRWDRLTKADLEATAGVRAALARRIAREYRIPVGAAKRQVHRFLQAVAAGGAVTMAGESGLEPSPPTQEIDDFDAMEEAQAEAEAPGGLAGESGEEEDR
jgi:hypothetical protein